MAQRTPLNKFNNVLYMIYITLIIGRCGWIFKFCCRPQLGDLSIKMRIETTAALIIRVMPGATKRDGQA